MLLFDALFISYRVMSSSSFVILFFFFSSRRRHTRCALVTGVQTCALPISLWQPGAEGTLSEAAGPRRVDRRLLPDRAAGRFGCLGAEDPGAQIGRASCRERVCQYV